MIITIDAKPEEIAALTNALQGRQGLEAAFVPETANGVCGSNQRISGSTSAQDM